MTSGPILVQVLEGEVAVARDRGIMGATDPKKAAPGTIRADLAASIEENIVHGSDAPETAAREIAYRSEERRVGKEWRARWPPDPEKKKRIRAEQRAVKRWR